MIKNSGSLNTNTDFKCPRPVGYTELFNRPISCYKCRKGQVSHQCFYSRRKGNCLFTKRKTVYLADVATALRISTLALKCFLLAFAITLANEAWDGKEKWKHSQFLNVSGKEKPLYSFHQSQKQVVSKQQSKVVCSEQQFSALASFIRGLQWATKRPHFCIQLIKEFYMTTTTNMWCRKWVYVCTIYEQPSVENPSTLF